MPNQMGERGSNTELTMKAEFGLIIGDNQKKPMDNKLMKAMDKSIE